LIILLIIGEFQGNKIIAKPPQLPSQQQRAISNSQGDLKNFYNMTNNVAAKPQKKQNSTSALQSQLPHQYLHPALKSASLSGHQNGHMMHQSPQSSPQHKPTPPISLHQKCAQCQQSLGQGSAMYIEKLELAFHLKCFRCSVCSVPLSNGKEGTDVRVSGLNRLHCNNCFSNDLGKCIINFNLIDVDASNEYALFSWSTRPSPATKPHDLEKRPDQACPSNNGPTSCLNNNNPNVQLKSRVFKDDYYILPNYLTKKVNSAVTKPPHPPPPPPPQHSKLNHQIYLD
jgi:hypothetical protein